MSGSAFSTAPEPVQHVHVEVTGIGSAEEQHYATEKIASLSTYAHRPLSHAHVTITSTNNHAVTTRVEVHASLDVGGRTMTATAEGATVHEAIDAVRDRLYRRLRSRPRTHSRVYAWVSAPKRKR